MARLFLFDGTALAYRAYYALDKSLSTSTGIPTNATYGVARMIVKFIKDHIIIDKDYAAVAFDKRAATFRHKLLETYKAQRPKTPDLLVQQLPYIKKLIEAFGFKVLEMEGYEADDIIATLAVKGLSFFDEIFIITGDKDMLQLVNEKIKVWRIVKGISDLELYDAKRVKEKYGVEPRQIPDFLALVGDDIDNIPGVPGVGEKTATQLLEKYKNLEDIFEHIRELPNKVAKAILRNRETAVLSKKLTTLETNVPIDLDWEELRYKGFNREKLLSVLKELEFASIMRELNLYEESEPKGYEIVKDSGMFENLVKKLKEAPSFALDLETSSLDPFNCEIVGISLSFKVKTGYYIPLHHKNATNLDEKKVLNVLKEILEDPSSKIVGQNLKFDYKVLMVKGIDPVPPHFDTMVAAHLLEPNEKKFNLEDLALKFLGYRMTSYQELMSFSSPLFGFSFADVPLEKAANYSCEDADIAYRLYKVFSVKLHEADLENVFYKIEMPLVNVLARMELNGVYVDTEYLKRLSEEYGKKLEKLTENIYKVAGEPFNINSPKQVSKILFEKLGIKPRGKTTKTGDYSTRIEILEEIASEHEIIPLILEYRKIQKLKSTYIDTLPKLVNPKTGRIHASFHQTGTATGRLSSSDPNLQNLPTKSEEGKEIRKAIVPQNPDWWIISADYSQIELRILAHLSGDENLIKAFEDKVDVHALTASRIYGVKPEEVTEEMRRVGKMVNFSIIYGVTPYGLSVRLGVPVKEAEKMIVNYFVLYPKVREYIQRVVAEAKEKGYVRTLFGRKRDIPQLMARDKNTQSEGERIAINTPIQGTAADIIKLAMIEIDRELRKRNMRSKMIIQVHDELVFEVPHEEKDILVELVKEKMTNVVKLSVPLEVDVNIDKTWS
ncbi:DNA polymerase I [Thermotoga sp. KOL6]|uniref:DNA polymerase I n=1 Tax=Thermotoga sp. KOL6 TaxID=126741 RepID=UPI000C794DAC|nr:DNA polymerase I [Thermotoga sp. KOL6]PLV60271.1 DNA polymerase I [Thermotoga sp. KOL6]